MPKTSEPVNIASVLVRLLPVVVLVFAAAFWLLRPAPVQLSEGQYKTTIALYRACNQRSDAGIDQIESLLAESNTEDSSEALDAIRMIIDDARQQRWREATKNCRNLLDDQAQR